MKCVAFYSTTTQMGIEKGMKFTLGLEETMTGAF
jgi:hypothetical protein